ncbi:MAG: hypothetical protein O2967_23060 [Proteobacteria bacterium]|nr:hypothetical protein [Pseudomonadota bacterium]
MQFVNAAIAHFTFQGAKQHQAVTKVLARRRNIDDFEGDRR